MDISTEIWADIVGFESSYQVSNKGRIRSKTRLIKKRNGTTFLKTGQYIKLKKTRKGYNRVLLYKNNKGKFFSVHRLVAMNFIPNPQNKPQINHIDGNKENNQYDNLEWVTCKENIAHAIKTGLVNHDGLLKGNKYTEKPIVCNETKETFKSISECSRILNVSKGYLSDHLNGKFKSVKGMTFTVINKTQEEK